MSKQDNGRPILGEEFPISEVKILEKRSNLETWLKFILAFIIVTTCVATLAFVAWFDFHDGDAKLCDFLPFATFVLGSFFTMIVGHIFRSGNDKG